MNHILLLHGATGSRKQLEPLAEMLSSDFIVHSINFPGHGGTENAGDFSINGFAESVLEFLQSKRVEKATIFGYSMGGYVGLYLARFYPRWIKSIATLGTKLHWNESIAAKEVAMLNAETIQAKVPKFAERLKELHHPQDWRVVIKKTAAMLSKIGAAQPLTTDDFAKIQCKVLLMLGDSDKMVSFEETLAAYKQVPNGQLALLPGTPHPFEQVNLEVLAMFIRRFSL